MEDGGVSEIVLGLSVVISFQDSVVELDVSEKLVDGLESSVEKVGLVEDSVEDKIVG